MGRIGLFLAPLLIAACADGPTEILVIAESDLAVPAELDAVRFEVDPIAPAGAREIRRAELASASDLPASLAIRLAGTPPAEPVQVHVFGELDGSDVASATADLEFVSGRLTTVRVWLGNPDPPPDAGPPIEPDAGMMTPDGGTPDAGSPDAGFVCPAECSEGCDPGCVGSDCDCRAGCICGLSCTAVDGCDGVCDAATCHVTADTPGMFKLKCEHDAICTVDARDAVNARIDCADAACAVDCTGAEVCEVVCNDASTCLLECAGALDCSFSTCRTQRLCAGGILACNRECP